MSRLIMFHGRECPHCRKMMPIVEELEKATGIAFDKKEVWHSQENLNLMQSLHNAIAPKCGGQLKLPTFFNEETQDVMCGEVDYEKLKAWAEKK